MVAEPQEKKKMVPPFRPGDTVKVHIKVVEGDSERIQVFEGTVISRRGRGDSESFTVRKMSFGVGVERTFPLSSPHIDRIELVKTGRVRRARLYYLRNLTGRAARLNEQEVRGGDETGGKPAGEASSAPAPKSASSDGAAAAKAKPAEAPKKQSDSASGSEKPRALGAASTTN